MNRLQTLKMPPLWPMLKQTVSDWLDDGAPRLGAALAYYSIFSLGPLIFLAIAIAGLIFGQEAASGQLYGELRSFFGPAGAEAIANLVASVEGQSSGKIATAVGAGVLLFAATGVVVQLKDALNAIWKVKPKPGRSIAVFIRKYIISLAAIIGVGFLLMVSLVLTAFLAAVGKYLGGFLPLPEWLLQVFNFILSFFVISLLFAMIFKFLPDVKLAWKNVAIGAVCTALLFTIGKSAIGLYLGKQGLDSTYGAAASLIVVLIWVYYSSQIVFFGAEFTKVYALRSGAKIMPTRDAVLEEQSPSPSPASIQPTAASSS